MFVLSAADAHLCQIVIPVDATAADQRGAAVLRDYLARMVGAEIRVVDDDQPQTPYEVLLGRTGRLYELGIEVDFGALKTDGFRLMTTGTRLVIAGGSERGVEYGVYTLLEDYLGCRKYTPEVEYVPQLEQLELPEIDVTQIPVIEFREDFYLLAQDPAYQAWHKLDRHVEDWGLWVHTFAPLLPPDEYFEAHPEYYSLIDGRRVPHGQLCLTNPEVLRLLIQNLRQEMASKPDALYWSVSQNDTFSNCQCDACQAVDDAAGSPSGSMLQFVNQIAAQFPDKIISTLAYQYTRAAPRNLRPADNVNIVLCSIECNRSRPISTDPASASFRRDVEAWAQICDNIVVWDYVIQFANLVSPFPNLRVLQPNIRYFVENNCVAMFQQGNREYGGEMAELRAYLIAKLLWNPAADVDALIDDFLQGYYGAAAPMIRAYIDGMHDALDASGAGLNIFGNPVAARSSYLTAELIASYNELFDRAEGAVAAEPELLMRVQHARLPLEYAMLEQAKQRATGEGGMFQRAADGTWGPQSEIIARLERFTSWCNRQGVTRVTEWHTTPDEYRSQYLQVLQRPPLEHLAHRCPIELSPPPSPKYPADGPATLTDGLRGANNHGYAWLGWEGTSMEGVVDLGEAREIRLITTAFLQSVGSWVLLPHKVDFAVSVDGREYVPVGSVRRQSDERRGGVFTESFSTELAPTAARFVKVKAESPEICPEWHQGAGGPCWIFADELIVQ
jgi:hypothetical protein